MAVLWGLTFALSLVFSSSIVSAAPTLVDSLFEETATFVEETFVDETEQGSVLEALLESHYSEWMELVERAQMLHHLEQLVGGSDGKKITIFAPRNHQLQPEIKSFVLQPSNFHLLKTMVEFHVLPERITSSDWHNASIPSLAENAPLHLGFGHQQGAISNSVRMFVGEAEVVAPDIIVRADGVVHGVDQLLLPMSVQQAYVSFTTSKLDTPLPTAAPSLDKRRAVLLEKTKRAREVLIAKYENHHIAFSPGVSPAPSPFMAPAPGPSLGPSGAPFLYSSKGEHEVTTFVMALQAFGGYSEFCGLLVDLTTLGAEISKLVNMGVKLTILAPDDTAWKTELTNDQLLSPTAIEQILTYHVITEYQTEESLYSTLRRNGKFGFHTLHVPLKVMAEEVDGVVTFGEKGDKASLLDHDIHANGWISVQGIDKVLIPPGMEDTTVPPTPVKASRSVFEILQLPSRLWSSTSSGPQRAVSTVLPAVAAFFVLLATTFLV